MPQLSPRHYRMLREVQAMGNYPYMRRNRTAATIEQLGYLTRVRVGLRTFWNITPTGQALLEQP
jgi:hypothetical protein